MRLRFSKLALNDLELIRNYTVAQWDEEQAVKYLLAIWDALEEIQQTPERWRLRPEVHPDCRVKICESHLSFIAITKAWSKLDAFCTEP